MQNNDNVAGDVVSGDKIVTTTAGGDIVGGHKVTQTGTGNIFTASGDVLVIQPQLSPASARERAGLLQLLKKVKTFWIEGVLERSVYRAYLLELGLDRRTTAIEHPTGAPRRLSTRGPACSKCRRRGRKRCRRAPRSGRCLKTPSAAC
jgi:hypothetical protein